MRDKSLSVKSNLTRHMQLHFPKEHVCEVCGKSFSLKQHLSRHQKQHLYPCIRLYKQGEAKLQCTDGSASSQKSILSFVKAAGTYTPPLPQSPLPCARVLRRAHMIMEMEKMSGEILCIDGTKKVCVLYQFMKFSRLNICLVTLK